MKKIIPIIFVLISCNDVNVSFDKESVKLSRLRVNELVELEIIHNENSTETEIIFVDNDRLKQGFYLKFHRDTLQNLSVYLDDTLLSRFVFYYNVSCIDSIIYEYDLDFKSSNKFRSIRFDRNILSSLFYYDYFFLSRFESNVKGAISLRSNAYVAIPKDEKYVPTETRISRIEFEDYNENSDFLISDMPFVLYSPFEIKEDTFHLRPDTINIYFPFYLVSDKRSENLLYNNLYFNYYLRTFKDMPFCID